MSSLSARQQNLATFLSSNFTVRQCRRYVKINFDKEPLKDYEKKRFAEDDCACGRPIEWHYEQHLTPRPQGVQSSKPLSLDDVLEPIYWDTGRDTLQKMCMCFGEVRFNISDQLVDEFDCDGLLTLPIKRQAPYLRLEGRDEDDYLKRVCSLLTTEPFWHLPEPGFILDLVGEPHLCNPDLEEVLVDKFATLISSVTKDNIWIVTSGKNNGVGKIVGRAVMKAEFEKPRYRVSCVGVDYWASTAGRKQLEPISGIKSFGRFPANYHIDDMEFAAHYLEPNHDCFLLVDCGKEIAEKMNFGHGVNFRVKLIDRLADPGKMALNLAVNSSNQVSGVSGASSSENWLEKRANFYNRMPSVLVVIGGGLAALEAVRANLTWAHSGSDATDDGQVKSRPVLLVTAFGGLADLLSYALQLPEPKQPPAGAKLTRKQKDEFAEERALFERKLQNHSGFMHLLKDYNVGEERVRREGEIMVGVWLCLSKRRNISVLDMKSMGHSSLGWSIFNAVFQTKQYSSKRTLELCLLLNEVDGAKKLLEEVESLGLSHGTLAEICSKNALQMLEQGLVKFYRLFTSFRYMKRQTIFSASLADSLYKKILQENRCASEGAELLSKLLVENRHALKFNTIEDLLSDEALVTKVGHVFELLVSGLNCQNCRNKNHSMSNAIQHRCLFRDIFLLQLLLGHSEMALEIWKDGIDHLANSLTAAVFLRRLAKKAAACFFRKLSASYLTQADEWHQRSVALLTKCTQSMQFSTDQLVWKQLPTWHSTCSENKQGIDLLQLAHHGHLRDFMAHDAVQTELKRKWFGRLAPTTNTFLVFLLSVCPLLWFPLIFFVKISPPEQKKGEESEEDGMASTPVANEQYVFVRFLWSCRNKIINKVDSSPFPIKTAITCVYSAPIAKFYLNLGFAIAFALLLSQITLSQVPDTIKGSEIVAWVWSFTLFSEYLRPSAFSALRSRYNLRKYTKFATSHRVYLHSAFGAQIIFLIAMIMRWSMMQDKVYVRTLYAIVCLHFWLKLVETFFATQAMGTRVILLRNLITDFSFFSIFYIIILVGFAVPMYAMLWPNQPMADGKDYFTVMVNVAYNRWWSLSNQLDTDEFNGAACTSSTQNSSSLVVHLFDSDFIMNPNECPYRNFVAVILYVVFIVITNIVLLRMLTALFTFTIQQSAETARKQWKFLFYELVHDFDQKMVLPPPLGPFQLIWEWIHFTRNRIGGDSGKYQTEGYSKHMNDVVQRATAGSLFQRGLDSDKSLHHVNDKIISEKLRELSVRVDDQCTKVQRRLAEIEKQQYRMMAKVTSSELFSRIDPTLDFPHSQNYA